LAFATFAVVAQSPADAGQTKVDVCHADGQGNLSVINVAEPAFQSHIDHGDAAIGSDVPGQSGFVYAADCSTELAAAPTVVFDMTAQCLDVFNTANNANWEFGLTANLVPAYDSYTVRVTGTSFNTSWTPTGTQPGDVEHFIGREIAAANFTGVNVPATVTITDSLGGVVSYSAIVPTGPQLTGCPTTWLGGSFQKQKPSLLRRWGLLSYAKLRRHNGNLGYRSAGRDRTLMHASAGQIECLGTRSTVGK
jgi:hypothetical protein